uniref:BTB domain-containing protein n=1 Tax=Tetradesmus obliquus TaxID=3088 RepID=A0A383V7S4_TETOB|eukprot:jgi/Sobl393_1/8991/SZX60812.1
MEATNIKSHRSTCSSINEFAFHSARGSTFSDADEEGMIITEPSPGTAAEITVIRLNVGGTSFATSLGTLTAVPGSYFAALFGSGHWSPSVVPGSQTPFIDRDPESFKYVLAYLRCLRHADSLLVLPDSPAQLRQLRAEAEFYNLPGLAQACSLGKWASAGLLASTNRQQQQHLLGAASWPGQLPPAQQQQQQQQQQHSSANGSSREPSRSSSLNGAMQAARDQLRHPLAAAAGLGPAASAPADVPVYGEDVMLSMQQ